MYKRRDYWRENIRRTFSRWRAATGVITFVLYVVFVIASFTALPQGFPRWADLSLRIVALAWLPLVLLLLTPVEMWIEAKNECAKLELKLTPVLQIGDKPFLQTWLAPAPGLMMQKTCRSFYLAVENISLSTSIEDVKVQVTRIDPPVENLDWLPVPLHIKHDNPLPGASSRLTFTLNAGETNNIDLVAAMDGSALITLEHVARGVNKSIPSGKRYDCTVTATGRDVAPATKTFSVFMNTNGELCCELSQRENRRDA